MSADNQPRTRGLAGFGALIAFLWLLSILLCLGELQGKVSLELNHPDSPLTLEPQKAWNLELGSLEKVSFPARLQVFLTGEKEAVYLILASGSTQRAASQLKGRTLYYNVKEPPGVQGLALKNLGDNPVKLRGVRLYNYVGSSPNSPRIAVMMGSGAVALPPARVAVLAIIGLAACLLLAFRASARNEDGMHIWHGLAFIIPPLGLLAGELLCQALGLHLEMTWETFWLLGLFTPGMILLPRFVALWKKPENLRQAAVIILVLICFAGVILAAFRSERERSLPGSISNMIHLGQRFAKERSYVPDDAKLEEFGYDGQFFLYIAQDPLAQKGAWANIDSPSYRYQRILFPVLMYGLTGGDRNILPGATVIFNLACLLASVIVLLVWLRELGISSLWAVLMFCNYGLIYPAFAGLSEPLANLFLLYSLYCIWDEKPGRAAWAMSLMVLTKEYYVILPAAAFLWALFSKQKTRLAYLTPLLVGGLWQAAVYWRFGIWSFEQSSGNFFWPLAGLFEHLTTTPYLSHTVFCIAVLVLLAVTIWQWFRGPRSEELVLLSLFLLLPLMAGPAIWASENGFMRVFSPAYLVYVLVVMGERTWILSLAAPAFALHAALQIMHY